MSPRSTSSANCSRDTRAMWSPWRYNTGAWLTSSADLRLQRLHLSNERIDRAPRRTDRPLVDGDEEEAVVPNVSTCGERHVVGAPLLKEAIDLAEEARLLVTRQRPLGREDPDPRVFGQRLELNSCHRPLEYNPWDRSPASPGSKPSRPSRSAAIWFDRLHPPACNPLPSSSAFTVTPRTRSATSGRLTSGWKRRLARCLGTGPAPLLRPPHRRGRRVVDDIAGPRADDHEQHRLYGIDHRHDPSPLRNQCDDHVLRILTGCRHGLPVRHAASAHAVGHHRALGRYTARAAGRSFHPLDGVLSCRLLVGLGLREAGRSLPGGSHWAWSAWTRASICSSPRWIVSW